MFSKFFKKEFSMDKFFSGLKAIMTNLNEFMKPVFNASLLVVGFLMLLDVAVPVLKMGIVSRVVWYISQIIKLSFTIFTR
jgi:hypothetical protein